jgi:hypothetical protein
MSVMLRSVAFGLQGHTEKFRGLQVLYASMGFDHLGFQTNTICDPCVALLLHDTWKCTCRADTVSTFYHTAGYDEFSVNGTGPLPVFRFRTRCIYTYKILHLLALPCLLSCYLHTQPSLV